MATLNIFETLDRNGQTIKERGCISEACEVFGTEVNRHPNYAMNFENLEQKLMSSVLRNFEQRQTSSERE